jgi:hypothetical protein
MASKDPQIRTQGIASKRRPVTVMIPQKLEIIKRPASSTSQRDIVANKMQPYFFLMMAHTGLKHEGDYNNIY